MRHLEVGVLFMQVGLLLSQVRTLLFQAVILLQKVFAFSVKMLAARSRFLRRLIYLEKYAFKILGPGPLDP